MLFRSKLAGVERGAELITRSTLLEYLKFCPEAQAAEIEANRREALAKKLAAAERDLRLRKRAINPAPGAEWATFADIPQVAVEPGRITIVASDAEDALRTLWSLSKAIATEYDRFAAMLTHEPPPGAPKL